MIYALSAEFFASEGIRVKFSGLEEPRLDSPEVEIMTIDGQLIDLYNDNFLHSVVRLGDNLAFEFESWPDRSIKTALWFLGVRDLTVTQPEDWHTGEAEQIEDFMIRGEGPWRQVVFKAGGLEYQFNSDELLVVVGAAQTPSSSGDLKEHESDN